MMLPIVGVSGYRHREGERERERAREIQRYRQTSENQTRFDPLERWCA